MTIKLIVGLGNPGEKYENTRHNYGFIWVDQLVRKFQLNWSKKTNRYETEHQGLRIIKPQDYMNNSCLSVAKVVRFYKIKTKEILVVYDDLDIAPGLVRFKESGGLGGHNGLKSIVQHVGSDEFFRLRIGIGRPSGMQSVTSFVLSKPDKNAYDLIEKAINLSISNIDILLKDSYAEFMQIVHSKNGDKL